MSATPDSTLADPQQIVADLQRQLAECRAERDEALAERLKAQRRLAEATAERDEALEQQSATAEVLQVINSSSGDLAPVLNAMLDKALRLCGADFGLINTYDGERFHHAADHGVPAAFAENRRHRSLAFGPGTAPARFIAGENVVHNVDLMAEEAYERGEPNRRALVDLGGARSHVTVALRKDGTLLGHLAIYRKEVRPFSDKQIALLQNFAAQAVIAMENARLLTETREALEQQTATAEVLGVINASPGNLAPVFDVMLEKALRLCEVDIGTLWMYDGETVQAAAVRGAPPQLAEFFTKGPYAPAKPQLRVLSGAEPLLQIADITATEAYRSGDPIPRAIADLGGIRTLLIVPLRKDDKALGNFAIYRREPRPFTDKQIALLQNFAAQAVIAMENARLITETREALEQQTATAEVLQVINASPGELAPVFDVMLEKATRLSEAAFGILWTYDGERFQAVALRDVPPAYVEFLREPQIASPVAPLGRVARGEAFAHVPDLAAEEYQEQAGFLVRQGLSLGGFRTVLAVPMRKDASLLGAITIYRREVQPFSDKQIALLQNFAAQAVIAMENARLIAETRERTAELQEALEYQTATSDVLKVISRSTFDLQPVLDTVAETAARLCDAGYGAIYQREDEVYRIATAVAFSPEAMEAALKFRAFMEQHPLVPDRGSITGRVALERRPVHVADTACDPEYRLSEATTLGNLHTQLGVPMLREGEPIGVIAMARQRVEPFTERQIELVQTFADQAVIAIENARLLNEIRQRQAELRVTFDNMADGVVMFDEELCLAAWNRNFQELLDLSDAALAERPSYADYLRLLAERGEFGTDDVEAELARRLRDTDQELRLERARPDGRVIEVRRNAVPDGGFVLIYSDITERKRSEEEIRAARDAAEAAYADLKAAQANLIQAEKMASLGQLTAGIAHEIKNPLNFVNNFAELSGELLLELKETTAPAVAALGDDERAAVDEVVEMLRGNLDKIAEHGKRADGIVKSMLEHSRGVSGERRVVDLNALIEEALNLAYHGARAQDASFNITLEREFDRGLAPTELAPQEMTRVFLNLFGNGFYATSKRRRDGAASDFRPTLKVATRDLGDAVEVRVRDNGTGIAPEIRDKLFQPFVTTKPTGEGTGLGLSIAWDIVTQQHGGTIEVDSRVGEFTEFRIRLPRQQMRHAV